MNWIGLEIFIPFWVPWESFVFFPKCFEWFFSQHLKRCYLLSIWSFSWWIEELCWCSAWCFENLIGTAKYFPFPFNWQLHEYHEQCCFFFFIFTGIILFKHSVFMSSHTCSKPDSDIFCYYWHFCSSNPAWSPLRIFFLFTFLQPWKYCLKLKLGDCWSHWLGC